MSETASKLLFSFQNPPQGCPSHVAFTLSLKQTLTLLLPQVLSLVQS